MTTSDVIDASQTLFGPHAVDISEDRRPAMMTNVNVIRTFVCVMDCGSVVAAARERGYSAAAVSRQIGWLQQRLGVKLFVPEGRSIRPTPAAMEFADRARQLIVEVGDFERFSDRFREVVGDGADRSVTISLT